jgi:hypothetical protein
MTHDTTSDNCSVRADLLLAAASTVSCGVDELSSRLGEHCAGFFGSDRLPMEIHNAWPSLPLEAKAVAVLFASALSEYDDTKWDRFDRV